jgi:putative phosphoesterase
MKVLVIADVHSNWPALRAVTETFDACLFLGDLVDYGIDPVPCIDWIKQHTTAAIRGNHDHAVAHRVIPRSGPGLRRLAAATRPLHWERVGAHRLKYLSRLPLTRRLEIDGRSFFLVHATPRDPLDEYLADDPDGWRARLTGIDADFVCVGHTHVPFQIDLDGQRVVNPGSVGQPRDGDPRASYAVIEDGVVQFKRVPYDIDETLRALGQSGLEDWVVELSAALLRSGGRLSREEMDAFR